MPADPPAPRMSRTELARFVEFIDRLEDETDQSLEMRKGYREMRMMVHLMRNHLSGRLTTPSTLAAASGLSYGTAVRAVNNVIERGLIVKRPRTRTSKTYSLHPSPDLIEQWQEYARRIKTLLGGVFGLGDGTGDYYFGASYMSGQIIPPLPALDTKLAVAGGLNVLVHADPTFMAMDTLKKQFEMVFGVAIRNRALSIDRLRDEIYRNAGAAQSRYDLIACDLPWFGELVEDEALLPLDDLLKRDRVSLDDFHPEAILSARRHGVQYGVPVQTTPELFVYRTDLFAEAGLPEPTTTTAALEAARALHDPFRGISGIAWNAARGTPVGHSFIMVMAAFGQPVINLRETDDGFDGETVSGEEYRPMFLSDAARETAEYLQALLEVSPPNILNMSWYERARAYASGQAAMAYCYTLLAPLFEHDPSSPARRHTGYLPHPTGRSARPIIPLGGYALAIPANIAPERIDASWEALKLLTSPGAVKMYLVNGSTVSPRFSVSGDPEVAALCPVTPIVDQMARSGLLKLWPRPPVPEITRIIAIAGEEIHDMLTGAKTIPEALLAAQNRGDALMRASGHY